MKILSWNCNGAFRNKFTAIKEFDADIYVIQECENPDLTNHVEYKKWSSNYLWVGDNKNRGVGVFAKNDIKIELSNWSNIYKGQPVKHFLPCKINNSFHLLAVWACQNKSPNFGYIGQIWKYLQINKSNFRDIIIAGDFNSNAIWDEWDRWWNHSDVVKELKELEIESLYHNIFQEDHGMESRPTFFLQRNIEKKYHIDYLFSSRAISEKINKMEIGDQEKWLFFSDHLPLLTEINI